MPPAVDFLTTYEYTAATHHCSPEWDDSCKYYIIWSTVIFVITVPVMIICYVCIIYHILKSDRLLSSFDTTRRATYVSKKSPGLSVHGNHRKNSSLKPEYLENSFPSVSMQSMTVVHGHSVEKYTDSRDVAYGAKENEGFQKDECVLVNVVKDEFFVDSRKSGPYVISGQIDKLAPSCKSSAGDGPDVTQRRSMYRQPQNDPASTTNPTTTDSAETGRNGRKMSAQKRTLSREKRVALTGRTRFLDISPLEKYLRKEEETVFKIAPYPVF